MVETPNQEVKQPIEPIKVPKGTADILEQQKTQEFVDRINSKNPKEKVEAKNMVEELKNQNVLESTKQEINLINASGILWQNHPMRGKNESSIDNRQKTADANTERGISNKITTNGNALLKYKGDIYESYDFAGKIAGKEIVSAAKLADKQILDDISKLNEYGFNAKSNYDQFSKGNLYMDLKITKDQIDVAINNGLAVIDRVKDKKASRTSEEAKKGLDGTDIFDAKEKSDISLIRNQLELKKNALVSAIDAAMKVQLSQQEIKPTPREQITQTIEHSVNFSNEEREQRLGETETLSLQNQEAASKYVNDVESKKIEGNYKYVVSGLADGVPFKEGGPMSVKVRAEAATLLDWVKSDPRIPIPKIDLNGKKPDGSWNTPSNQVLAFNRMVKYLKDVPQETRENIIKRGIERKFGTTSATDKQGTQRFGAISLDAKGESIITLPKPPKYLNDIKFELTGNADPTLAIMINGHRNSIGANFSCTNESLMKEARVQRDVDNLFLHIVAGVVSPDMTPLEMEALQHDGKNPGEQAPQVKKMIEDIRAGKYSSVNVLTAIFNRNHINAPGYDYSYVKIPGEK